ncbi:MAG: GxxExxY protein [Chthoniobacterales bacterium]
MMDSENEIGRRVLDAAYKVHTALGPGLLETVYEVILVHEILESGLAVERQKPIPIHYGGKVFLEGFRADLVVEDKVIVELKSCESLLPVHGKQLLTQLRLSDRKLGFLINFGAEHLRHGIKRVVNGLAEDEEASRKGRQGREGGEEEIAL